MTLFILYASFGLFAIVALFWCLRGFSGELKHGRKIVGTVVSVETIIDNAVATNHAARKAARVIEITRPAALHSGRSA